MDEGRGPARTPLSVSWREWLASADWRDGFGQRRSACGAEFDAIVIGSGYGGSVAALRLAQKNHRVLVLERGSEYLPGEFPNDFSLVPPSLRANVPGRGLPMGRATGLIEVHLGQGMVGVSGNGLGGGSLVNAGVAMQPDPEVFAQPAWPAAIRLGHDGGLAPFFERAREQLRVRTWDASIPNGGRLRKTQALERAAARLGHVAQAVDVTIGPGCKRCGDCASGCNVDDAKQSLDRTYLQQALETQLVQIVTQAEVYRFEHAVDGEGRHVGWKVHVFATDAQEQFVATAQVFTDDTPAGTARTLVAPMLFVCAGTFGSTQLMQRSQALSGGALAFSPALGTRVSGNGDSLSWLVDEEQPVAGVGLGQRSVEAWEQAGATPTPDVAAIVGPTITAAIDLRRRADGDTAEPQALPLEQRLVVQEAAVPRAIAQISRELLATATTLKRLDDWWLDRPAHAQGGHEDPLAAGAQQADRAQTLLVMGHDGSPARIVWLEGLDRSAPYLPQPEQLATYVRQQELFDRFGRRHVHNPLWQPMPADAMQLMSGDKPPRSVLTVHPLGGCAMGDDPDSSVVDAHGRVWVHDPGSGRIGSDALEPAGVARSPGRDEPHVYRGLHVLDGSIVPTSLGCNPLWTITALAERALEAIPRRTLASRLQVRRGAERTPAVFPSRDVPVAARLNELLLARDARLSGSLARCLGADRAQARLEATFHSVDIVQDMVAQRHPLRTEATLVIGRDAGGDESARLRYRGEGRFEALPAGPDSAGPWLFVRCMAEASLLVLGPWASAVLLASWLAAPAALAALLVLLPYPRTWLTWVILRGARDGLDAFRSGGTDLQFSSALALARQLVHASEKRVMRYAIPLRLDAAAEDVRDAPAQLHFRATKTVMYRAGIGELVTWMARSLRQRLRGSKVPVALRATVWEQVMNAQVRITEASVGGLARTALRGVFGMGFENLTASGLAAGRETVKPPIELGLTGDTSSGILALASYPLLFLRFAFKTRLLDFRLPSYSGVPLRDQAPPAETELRHADGPVPAQLHWLSVPRGRSDVDDDDEDTAPLRLQLWRYRRRDAQGRPAAPELLPGEWQGRPVVRARSVLLLHAFAQSGTTYTLKTIEENLAERFYREGYEVWVLEMRMSTRSGYASDPCSVDQVGRHDVPSAVRHIVRTLMEENGVTTPLQIGAFAQCMGSAALWIAALSGRLRFDAGAPEPQDADRATPALSMLSHAMFSQVHPWVVGARATQSKTWMPALLQALWRRGTVPFAVRGAQQGLLMPLVDRVLASMPAPAAEGRRNGGHEDAAATCRRIRFIEAPLFRHENVNDATFGAMNLLFGEANLRLFAHARRFVDRERLVDEDGVNRYVTEENLRRHVDFPVQLLHGAANELFDVSSATRSFTMGLRATHAGWQERFCTDVNGRTGPLLIEGYGHLDVLIGHRAHVDVYPHILRFFDACLAERVHRSARIAPTGWAVRTPRAGPFVGWLREEDGQRRLRVSIVIDDRKGSRTHELPPIRVRYRPPGRQGMRTLALPPSAWQAFEPLDRNGRSEAMVQRLAWADLPLQGEAADATEWQVLTLHESWLDARTLLPRPNVADAVLDRYLESFALPPGALGPVVPPVSNGGHDFGFAGASFRIPSAALATLTRGHAVRFAVGSCRHPGLGVDRDRVDQGVRDFLAGQATRPSAFALLVGDQIYADATAGLLDPASPLERYHARHEQAFDRHGLGELLAALPVYMTPDDHEWIDSYPTAAPLVRAPWPDWSAGSAFQVRQRRVFETADRAVSAFQRLQSPLAGQARSHYTFEHGCVRCFVIDSRLGRRRDAPQIVDPEVLTALAEWLAQGAAGDGMLNVIACGSVVMPALRINSDPADPGPLDTWQYAEDQRKELLALLVEHVPRRFLLLSGDYHVSGAGVLERDGQVVGAAVVAPPLYAPMPYANASPEMVDAADRVWLGVGRGWLQMKVEGEGVFARGSGLGVLDVRRQGGGFAINYRRTLRVWEAGRQAVYDVTLHLPAGAGVGSAASPSLSAPS